LTINILLPLYSPGFISIVFLNTNFKFFILSEHFPFLFNVDKTLQIIVTLP